jgi:hypothetical protein
MKTVHGISPDYRQAERQILARWIVSGQSGAVIGLPGCGRSNLLEFWCTQSEPWGDCMPAATEHIVLVPVNLFTLPASDIATFYRVLLRAFYHTSRRFASDLHEAATRFYYDNIGMQDPFVSQSALQELLFLFYDRQTRIVLVLNQFDHFLREATPQLVNTLRGLRDSFKHTLSFVVGMQQEVAYLPNPELLGEMYELLDRNVCWVGAMSHEDAQGVIEQTVHATGSLPTAAETNTMLRLSGNFPALLQLIVYWWQNTSARPPVEEWLAALLAENNIRRRLIKMWEGLTQEEQFLLSEIAGIQGCSSEKIGNVQSSQPGNERAGQPLQDLLVRLSRKGICEQTLTGWSIRGDLFLAYVKEVGTSSRGRIWLDQETHEINQGLARIDDLTPLERRLLQYLILHPYQPHENEALIDYVWEDKAMDMVDNDLQQLIYRLRKKIDVIPPQYIITWKGRPGGYQFYPEGRPK